MFSTLYHQPAHCFRCLYIKLYYGHVVASAVGVSQRESVDFLRRLFVLAGLGPTPPFYLESLRQYVWCKVIFIGTAHEELELWL